MKKTKNKWTAVAASLLIWGCSSSPKIDKLPDSADARSEISRLQQDLADAAHSQVDVVSPKAWSEATDYCKQAEARLADQASPSRILYSIAESRAWLNKARTEADQAGNIFPDLLEVRQQAMEAKARQYAANEWSDAETYFRRLTRDREGTNVGISDSNRIHIQDLYKQARIVALQNFYLGDARTAIHDAQAANGSALVPHVFEQAQRTLKNAEAFIAANPMDIAAVDSHAAQARAEAKRLLRLTKEAVALKGATPEQQALVLDRVKSRNRSLAGALDQQAFEQKFEEARQMFNPDDAEVYKQGDQLLVRMKGIEFPTASASIPSASFALITKVGTVIKNFGEPRVRIEGHTDSVGGKALNDRLSQERAEAVKSYLIATSGLKPELIEIQGMGYSRPLASNKSADGRAQNRRVDVIVMPQVEQGGSQLRQAQ